MKSATKDRLIHILFFLILIGVGVCIILYNLEQSITFFYPPSRLQEASTGTEIRVGGLVKPGSIIKGDGAEITFVITDNIAELQIHYNGLLPALFREKQGIIARGRVDGTTFKARELLTKHDENYMPPEISSLTNAQ